MQKDDSFWLNLCYLLFAALVGYVAWQAVGSVGVQTGWGERYDQWYDSAGYAISAIIGIGAALFLRMNKERNEYFLSAIAELRKVSWPSMVDTRRMTIIVCVVVGFFSVLMLVFDILWSYTLKGIISSF